MQVRACLRQLTNTVPDSLSRRPSSKPAVALITETGAIVSGKGSSPASFLAPTQEIASTPLCDKLIKAREDPQIKAAVLRIDSPGLDFISAEATARQFCVRNLVQ